MSTTAVRKGKVAQVIGPVVDVEFFTEEMPPINTAIKIVDAAKNTRPTGLRFSSKRSPAYGSTIIHVPSSLNFSCTCDAAPTGSPMSCRQSKKVTKSYFDP